MSEISPQTSELDLKSKVPPVYLRRMFGISPYALGGIPNPDLLLHFDVLPFVDSSLNAATITNTGSVALDTVGPKFGAASAHFPSVTFGSTLFIPVAANGPLDIFGPMTGGDFTIQGFFKAPAFGEPFVIMDYGDSSGGGNHNGIVIEVHDANTILVTPTISGWGAFSNGGSAPLPANTWFHFALVRTGSIASFYLNGLKLANGAANWTTSTLSPGNIIFGASATVSGASQPFNLDEVSVYSSAIYSANFTPQVAPTQNPVLGRPFPPVRGVWEMAGVTYTVIGDSLFSVTNDGTFTFPQRAATLTLIATGIAGQGFVRMTDNTKCLFILVPNTNIGYTFTIANGFAQELDETFTFFGAKDVWFIDSFMVFLALNGLEFYNDDGAIVSGTGPITFTSGGVFPREFGTDPFVGMCVDHRTVHMFGTRTTEGYVDAGNATESPFAAAPDAFMQIGCHPNCGYTIALQDQAVFWVANDLTVRRLNGQTPVRVSNSGIESFLENNKDKLGGAYGFSPTVGGHPLWVLTLPLAGKSFAYDCLTTEWFDLESLFGNIGYWRPLCYFNSQGLQLVGDSQSSALGFLDANTFTEFGSPQTATFYTQSVYDKHNRIRHNRVELIVTAGGSTSITQNARVTILISNDSGAVFHNGQVKNLGVQGKRSARAIWYALGMSRDRSYGFQISDPTPTFTVEVTADLAGGKY
jgi:Concanavalin A-like lectin/glucanases superfamily